MTCGSLIEHSSGVAVSFITLKNLLKHASKTNNHRKQLEQHLHSFALLLNNKTTLIGKSSSQTDAMLRQRVQLLSDWYLLHNLLQGALRLLLYYMPDLQRQQVLGDLPQF
jgi:hypothetical protein